MLCLDRRGTPRGCVRLGGNGKTTLLAHLAARALTPGDPLFVEGASNILVAGSDLAVAHGAEKVNMHLAQIIVTSLRFTIYGAFAGVHLKAGGMGYQALIGRTFLRNVTMVYEGLTGTVSISMGAVT